MSYRLKRKKFNCENCQKSWNALVGGDVGSIKCENCNADSNVVAPIQSQQDADEILKKYAEKKFEPKSNEMKSRAAAATGKTAPKVISSANITFTSSSMGPTTASTVTSNPVNKQRKPPSRQVEREEKKSEAPQDNLSYAQMIRGRENLQNQGYGIVFNKSNSNRHNRMDFRDTSSDARNINGDYNTAASRAGRQQDDVPDLEFRSPQMQRQTPSRRDAKNLQKEEVRQSQQRMAPPSRGGRPKATENNESEGFTRDPRARQLPTHAERVTQMKQMKEQQQKDEQRQTEATIPPVRAGARVTLSRSGARVVDFSQTQSNRPSQQQPQEPRMQPQPQQAPNVNIPGERMGMDAFDAFQSFAGGRSAGIDLNRNEGSLLDQAMAQARLAGGRMRGGADGSTGMTFPNGMRVRLGANVGQADESHLPSVNLNRPSSGRRQPAAEQARGRQPRAASMAPGTSNAGQPQAANPQANPFRARSTTFRNQNGNLMSIVNIGIERDHPLAANDVVPGSGGLHNINIAGNSVPAPQFVVMHRPREGEAAANSSQAEVTEQDRAEGERIAGLVNDLLGRFNDIFSSHDFLRMRTMHADFNPHAFMQNFNQNFASNNTDDSMFEMIRRMSEQEAEKNRKKKKPSAEAVAQLAIVKIEPKHCRKLEGKNNYEPPSCTVCVDPIAMLTKGMFMPCGHIFHPDCLKPWLDTNNTCPVCRFELPLESDTKKA